MGPTDTAGGVAVRENHGEAGGVAVRENHGGVGGVAMRDKLVKCGVAGTPGSAGACGHEGGVAVRSS